MESSKTLDENNLSLHIEYFSKTNLDYEETYPGIVISTTTVAAAKELFEKMRDRWGLNVRLANNQIILMPSNDAFCTGQTFNINFPPPSDNISPAKEFCELIESARKNSCQLPALNMNARSVQLINLIHPTYSYNKRRAATLIIKEQCVFYIFVMKNIPELNRDIISQIALFCYYSRFSNSIDTLRFTPHYLSYIAKINCWSGLARQGEISLFINGIFKNEGKKPKITISEIHYQVYGNPNNDMQYKLHLQCKGDSYYMAQFKKNFISFNTETKEDYSIGSLIITILHHTSKPGTCTFIRSNEKFIGLRFKNAALLDHLLEHTNILVSGGFVEDNFIYFPEKSLHKVKVMEVNTLPGISVKKGEFPRVKNDDRALFHDNISIRKIEQLPENINISHPVLISHDIQKIVCSQKNTSLVLIPIDDTSKNLTAHEIFASFHVPIYDICKHNLVKMFGGICVLTNVWIMKQNEYYRSIHSKYTDISFVTVPNMNSFTAKYFSEHSYLKHMTSLFILQFYLARFTNNRIIMDRTMCELYKHYDKTIASIVWAINEMPEFKNIEFIFSLAEKYTYIYLYPQKEKMETIKWIIEEIRQESDNFDIIKLSENIKSAYNKGKENAESIEKKALEICEELDKNIIDNLNRFAWNGLSLFNNAERNTRLENYITILKNNIKEGFHEGKNLAEIICLFRKTTSFPACDNENIQENINNELSKIVIKFDDENYTLTSKPKLG